MLSKLQSQTIRSQMLEPCQAGSVLPVGALCGSHLGFLPSCTSGSDCSLAMAVVAGPGRVPLCQLGKLTSSLCWGVFL